MAPVFSQLALGTAGFDDSLDFLSVSKDEPFVKATGFLPWLPVPAVGAAAINATVAAPKDLISAAACLGGRIAPTIAARSAWLNANPLTSRITLDAIGQQAYALNSLGALTTNHTDSELYRKGLVELLSTQPDLSSLELDEDAIEEPSPFDDPGGLVAVVAGRGAGGGRRAVAGAVAPAAAAPPNPGPPELKWLTLARTTDLVDGGATLPLERLLRLWTLLPGRCEDAERRDTRSLLRATAEELHSGVCSTSSIDKPSDARLGRSLRPFCETALIFPLPRFRLDALNLDTVAVELSDAIAYAQGSASDGARALARRLMFGKREYGDMCTLLCELASPEERVVQLERLSTLACPGRHAQALHLRLTEINLYVRERAALVTTGRNAGKTGEALFDLLVADAQTTGTDHVTLVGQHGASESGGGGSRRLSAHALQMALQGDDAFLQAADQIAAQDTSSAAGRRKVLELATGAGCVIFQQTMDRSEGLKQRAPALDALVSCLAESSNYFGQRQASDSSGAVDPLAQEWQMHQSQVKLLCHGKISQMQLINPPHGVIGLLNLTASEPYEPVPEAQLYITDSVLEVLGPFMHNTLVAWAGAGVARSTSGYTFLTLCEAQREYVRWIHKQGDQVQAELLPHADKNFRQALERIDLELRVVLDSAEPHKAVFGHLLCFGESFDQAIAAKKEGLKPLITIHRALPGLIAKSAPRSLPGVELGKRAHAGGDGQRDERGKGRKEQELKGAAKPGSKAKVGTWLDDDTLKLGGDKFNVTAYAAKLGLSGEQTAQLCWPVLCSRQGKNAALVFCPHANEPGHKGADDKAHRRPKGFDLTSFLRDFGEEGKSPPAKGKKTKK